MPDGGQDFGVRPERLERGGAHRLAGLLSDGRQFAAGGQRAYPLAVQREEQNRRVGHHQAHELLARPQRRLRARPRGHVDEAEHRPHKAPVVVEDRHHVQAEAALQPVRTRVLNGDIAQRPAERTHLGHRPWFGRRPLDGGDTRAQRRDAERA